MRSSRAPRQWTRTARPIFRVDPFWPKPLPNRWSMQQVTGIHVDHEDHIWFLNRAAAAEGDEIGGDGNPPRIDCCVRGPEVIELDQDGTVVHAWGGPGYHPALADGIADGDRGPSGIRLGRRHRAAGQHPQVHARRKVRVGFRPPPAAGRASCPRTISRPTSWCRKGAFSSTRSRARSTSSTGSACSCTTWTRAPSSAAGAVTACR